MKGKLLVFALIAVASGVAAYAATRPEKKKLPISFI